MEIFGLLWNEVIMRPMINSLAVLYDVLFDNFGLSIIVFTVLIRLALIPLTVRQTRQMKKMQALQPRMKAIQEKYKDRKDRESRRKQSQETMALYREMGVNPIGCLGPIVVQMPIWIGLYRAILRTMPPTPEGMANLSASFYAWNPAISSVPLNSKFLGIDLVDFVSQSPAPWNLLFPVLVGASLFIQQKMTMTPASDPRQQQTNQIMLWMLPIMFGAFTFQFPAGLALYILFSNIIGVVIQYYVGGKQPIQLFGRTFLGSPQTTTPAVQSGGDDAAAAPPTEEPGENEPVDDSKVLRKNRRRGYRRRSRSSRRRARGR